MLALTDFDELLKISVDEKIDVVFMTAGAAAKNTFEYFAAK